MHDADAPTESARERFLKVYLADLGRGEPRPLDDYLALFPDSEAEVAAEYRLLEDEADDGRAHDDRVADATSGSGPSPVRATPGETLGRYQLVRELGRGGQAHVYLAHDPERGTDVALKVLRASRFGLETSGSVQRLRREAELTARLDHPGICEVFDLGEDRDHGLVWIAMRYVSGETLAAHIARTQTTRSNYSSVVLPAPPPATTDRDARDAVRRVLELVEHLARALHVAHESGLIHRDVKPANVIVRDDGQPVILDFGMAREEDSGGSSLTMSGDLLGTPYYMSPEQLLAKRVRLDRRTDVYSLGVTLYECLTLRCPFEADSREALYQRILTEPPPDPTRLNRHLPRELKTVLETAIDKNRDRRYPTALAFAEDLRRLRHSQPIAARRLPWTLRLTRWSHRNPAASTFFAVLSVALVVAFLLLREVSREQQNTQDALDAVEARNVELRAVERAALLRDVAESIDAERAEVTARRAILDSIPQENRGFAWSWLDARCESPEPSMRHHVTDGFGRSIDLHPDGHLYAAVTVRGDALVRNEPLNGVLRSTGRLRFGVAGSELLTDDEQLWAGRELTESVFAVRFTNSGRLVTGDTHTRAVTLWDARSSRPVRRRDHGARVLAVTTARDGTVASAGEDGSVRIWEAEDLAPRQLPALEPDGAPIRAIDFSPDGTRLLIGGDTGVARILDARTGATLRELTYGRALVEPGYITTRLLLYGAGSFERGYVAPSIRDAAFGPGGDLVALAGDDGARVALFDAHDGDLLHDLRPHVQQSGADFQSTGVAFDPFGRWLLSCGTDGQARVHSVTSGRTLGSVRVGNRIWAIATSESFDRIVAASNAGGYWDSRRGRVSAWNPEELPLPRELVGHVGTVHHVATTRDGRFAYTADEAELRAWDLSTGRQLFSYRDVWLSPLSLALHPDEHRVALGGASGRGVILDAQTGATRLEIELPADVIRPERHFAAIGILSLCYSPDGAWLAVGPGCHKASRDHTAPAPVLLYDARTGQLRHRLDGHVSAVISLAFTADGERLLSVQVGEHGDGELRIWDLSRTEPDLVGSPVSLTVPGSTCAVNPVDGLAYLQTSTRTISAFDPQTGERLRDVPFVQGQVKDIDFHPTANEAIVTTATSTAIWDVPMRNQLLVLPLDRPHSTLARTRFCGGGRGILATGGRGFVSYAPRTAEDDEHAVDRGVAWRAARTVRTALIEHETVDEAGVTVAADPRLGATVRDAALELLANTTDDSGNLFLSAYSRVAVYVERPDLEVDDAALAQAEAYARAALPDARPDSFQEAVYHTVLGTVLYWRGRQDARKYEQALHHLEIGTGAETLRDNARCSWPPANFTDHFIAARAHLAMTCHALGRTEEALDHLDVARARSSGGPADTVVLGFAEHVLRN